MKYVSTEVVFVEIPNEIIRGFVKLLKSALEDTGIKITTQITELD